MTPLLVPRIYHSQSPARFIENFQQAAAAESTLLEWRGVVSRLIEDPPELETVTAGQPKLKLDLLLDASAMINRMYASAFHQLSNAATLITTPEFCSQLVANDLGKFVTVPISAEDSWKLSADLVTQGVDSLHRAELLVSAILEEPGFYTAHIPKSAAVHFRELEERADKLLETFSLHADPRTAQGPDNERAVLLASLRDHSSDFTQLDQKLVEIELTHSIYTDVLTSMSLITTLTRAYNCLQPQGRFIKTYLHDHPAVVKVLQACGIRDLESPAPC